MGPVTGSTLWEMTERRAAATPDDLMLADEHGRRITFAAFVEWAERVAAGLHGLGIGEGTVVSWQLPTRIETTVLSMALSRLGAVQNPIIHLYREREVASLLRTTGAAWFVVPGVWKGFDYEAMAESIRQRVGDRDPFGVLNGYADLPEGDPTTLPPPPSDGDVVRWLYSTSGTTSEPKAVCHTDGTLIAGGIGITEALRPARGSINAIPFPYAHIGGPDNLVMMLRSGTASALVEAFVPAESFAFFADLSVTHLGGSTAHYLALAAEQARTGVHPVPTMHTMCGGGAPKPAEVFWRVKERTGVTVMHGYGMTECPMIACGAVGDTDEQLANSDGAPVVGCEILVVDEAEQPVPAGVDGDILVRGPMLAKGYMQPEQTRESFRDDGFFRTGDRGHLRDDGHIVITGRSKELIIRKGENISPREIEDVLMSHPAVGAIAVIGLPDDERGERVCAVIETTVGSDPITFQAMAQHCRDAGLMTQKIPEQLEIVDALPRNPTMKILKRVLLEQLSKGASR
ncbi:MAG: class I adenylate-forming enzyme family protein [Acidimicrobiia bacterium]